MRCEGSSKAVQRTVENTNSVWRKMPHSKVDVVVPCYNYGRFPEATPLACFGSALFSTFEDPVWKNQERALLIRNLS